MLNHRKFDKPCFVPVYSNGLRLVLRVVIIYLQTDLKKSSVPSSVQFLQKSAPTIIWVSHSWGLPRSILPVSESATSLWHFSGDLIHMCKAHVGLIPAVNAHCAKPRLIFSPSTNTTVISEPCEHGLSSTTDVAAIT